MDIVKTFIEALYELKPELACVDFEAALEDKIRTAAGGEQHYIYQNKPEILKRNNAIVRDWQRGERIEFLSKKYKLTSRRILQIVKRFP